MDTLNVAGYGNSYTGNVNNKSYLGKTSSASSSAGSSSGTSGLGMNDFLNLLVAQMRNQDIMNPQDNTQFVAQMAQFSSLQAMTEMSKTITNMEATVQDLSIMNSVEYGASLMGKKVKISFYDKDNNVVKKSGIVANVCPSVEGSLISLKDDPKTFYHSANIMEIFTEFDPETTDDSTKTESSDVTTVADSGSTSTNNNTPPQTADPTASDILSKS